MVLLRSNEKFDQILVVRTAVKARPDWGVSLFYDAGNAFNSFSAVNLAQGAGAGVHYFSSIGALNLSVARPLGVENPATHIHFTVGFEL